jgi:hypothetical protein
VRAENVDRKVLFERGPIVEVVVAGYAGVVDEEVEGFDGGRGRLDLGRVGHV